MSSHWLIVTCIYFLWTCVQLSDSRPQDVTQETWNPITTSPRSISSPIVILQTTRYKLKKSNHTRIPRKKIRKPISQARRYAYPPSNFNNNQKTNNDRIKVIRSFNKTKKKSDFKAWPDTHITSHEEMEMYQNYTSNLPDQPEETIKLSHLSSINVGPVPIFVGGKKPEVPKPIEVSGSHNIYAIEQPYTAAPFSGTVGTIYPHYPGTIRPPQHSVNIGTSHPFQITAELPQATKPPIKCPTVYITALELGRNSSGFSREDCSDVKIVINSQIHNHNDRNDQPVTEAAVVQESSVPISVQNDNLTPTSVLTSSLRPNTGNTQSDNADNEEAESAIVTVLESLNQSSWIDTLNPILGLLLTPLSVIAAGGLSLLALIFPYSLPSFFASRSSRKIPSTKVHYHPSKKEVDGWYWHDGYQTWSFKPPESDEYDRKDDNAVKIYYPSSPYTYYGDRGKRRRKS